MLTQSIAETSTDMQLPPSRAERQRQHADRIAFHLWEATKPAGAPSWAEAHSERPRLRAAARMLIRREDFAALSVARVNATLVLHDHVQRGMIAMHVAQIDAVQAILDAYEQHLADGVPDRTTPDQETAYARGCEQERR